MVAASISRSPRWWAMSAAAVSIALAGCAGSGGGGGPYVQAVPPTPQPPARNTSLDIIKDAPSGVLAVAGGSSSAADATFASVTIRAADQPSFRYDAATDVYEIKLPSGSWEKLSTTDATLPEWARRATSDSTAVQLGLDRKLDTADPFPYSTMVEYWAGTTFGWLALGVPTADAELPTSGSATFDGIIRGSADYWVDDGWGGLKPSDVEGTVTLAFDFAKGSLTGSMQPFLWAGAAGKQSLGTFDFRDAVYSAGHYSGSFVTDVPGVNGFNGQLTGPNGQELIGGWALPFVFDSANHQAFGAWVAKTTH